MNAAILIRPFDPTDAAYEAVACINSQVPAAQCQDFEPRSGHDLRHLDTSLGSASYRLRRYVAVIQDTDEIIAYGHLFHTPWAFDEKRYWCAIRCNAKYQRQGIGKLLYEACSNELDRLGATSIWAEAREGNQGVIALLQRLGFVERLRSLEFELDVKKAETALDASKARSSGVVMTTLPQEKGRDPNWLDRLHTLYMAVMAEVPLPDTPVPYSKTELVDHLEHETTSLPEACLIARDGDRYVGFCILHKDESDPGRLNHLVTGVDSAYRGRGVAMGLKQQSIFVARRDGYQRIWTAVESNNPPMLAINEKVGFVHRDGLILFEKSQI